MPRTTPSDASRIQSTQAKAGNDTAKGSFSARAQGAGARNANADAAAKSSAGGAKLGGNGGKSSSRASGKK